MEDVNFVIPLMLNGKCYNYCNNIARNYINDHKNQHVHTENMLHTQITKSREKNILLKSQSNSEVDRGISHRLGYTCRQRRQESGKKITSAPLPSV